jgi:CubicO group peptidase (beta-lactamase class C family)
MRLEARLDRWVQENDVSSAAVLAWQCGLSVVDIQHGMHRDTEFIVASASKWVAAAALLVLVDEGVMTLDAPLQLEGVEGLARQITLRQALSHTSGLSKSHACLKEPDMALSECARAGTVHMEASPCARFRYGAMSFHLAAAAAEQATGETWAEILESSGPIGLGVVDFANVDVVEGDPSR